MTVSAPAPQPQRQARTRAPRKPATIIRGKAKLAPASEPLSLRMLANVAAGIGTAAAVIVASFAITAATLGAVLLIQ